MKKLIALSFLFIFLGANTELHQLLRLPVLIHHFLEHHHHDHDETFTDFLNDHYTGHQNHSDTDHHDHDNLPFKTNDCAMAHVSIAFVNHSQFSVPRLNTIQDKASPACNSIIYSSAFIGNIWQPPKIC